MILKNPMVIPMDRNEILSNLIYQPANGIFRWKRRSGGKATRGRLAGSVNSRGYVCIKVNGKNMTAHRIAFYLLHGWLPEEVDHIDGDKLNNSAVNLRASSKSQNQHNSRMRKDNSSGVKGVHWDSKNNLWVATVRCAGVRHGCGTYKSKFDAACAVFSARNRLHGEFVNHGCAGINLTVEG